MPASLADDPCRATPGGTVTALSTDPFSGACLAPFGARVPCEAQRERGALERDDFRRDHLPSPSSRTPGRMK